MLAEAEHLRKARLFAERYTPQDLDRIETLCRENRTVLGVSLMDRLVSLVPGPRTPLTAEERRERKKLAKKLERDAIVLRRLGKMGSMPR